MRTRRLISALSLQLSALVAACSSGGSNIPIAPPPAPAATTAPVAAAPVPRDTIPTPKQRVALPRIAMQLGVMPVASTGVTGFRLAHPTYDGRGVLIAILDSGVDPGIDGLRSSSQGLPKILDLRDFSGEGDIALTPAGPGRWTGTLRELPFGGLPQADFNGDGSNRGSYAIEVSRDSLGWMARIDTDGNGSLDGEAWVHDFLVKRETFSFSSAHVARGRGPITAALNFSEVNGQPGLAVYLDNSGHGSHVSGIAAGHNIYGVPGFDGVAPGAQIIGLKIADNARGGVSTTGSMVRAMEYAVRFAAERRLPLVMNMSFGVGNANEGRAVMDSIVNAFLRAHPEIVFTIAAGNDGPGTSTTGLPGSAELGVSVGASYPAALAQLQYNAPGEVMGWWSSRGGEMNKPDIVAPGLAYSTVPGWDIGNEIKGGTSMAAPHVAGLAALLVSAMAQEQKPWTAGAIVQALRATARPFTDLPWIDQGPGLAQIEPALAYLRAGREAPRFSVQVMTPGAVSREPGPIVAGASRVPMPPGAYRRNGLASPADTIQRFRVSLVPDPGMPRRARQYRLMSDQPWLRTAQSSVTIDSSTGSAVVEVHYDRAALARAGRYSGVITGIARDDSAAGAAFALVNTVIVPTAQPVHQVRNHLAGGRAAHYFVTVSDSASGLAIVLRLPDTTMQGSLNLFEPTGQPARGAHSEDVGGENGKNATLMVTGNDILPGVWEIVVQALPGDGVTYDLEVRTTPALVTRFDGGSAHPAVRVETAGDTALVAAVQQVGADTAWTETVATAVDRRDFVVPAWAARMVAEVAVTPETWDQLTDFAITMYDADGAQLGQGAMNYPFIRVSADLPATRTAGYRATLELFPAFARPTAAAVQARVRVRFEADSQSVNVVSPLASRPAEVPLAVAHPLEVAPGWRRVVRVIAGKDDKDPLAMTRMFSLGAP